MLFLPRSAPTFNEESTNPSCCTFVVCDERRRCPQRLKQAGLEGRRRVPEPNRCRGNPAEPGGDRLQNPGLPTPLSPLTTVTGA